MSSPNQHFSTRFGLLVASLALAGCSTAPPTALQHARAGILQDIQAEALGDYYIGRRYYKPDYKFWGYVRRPGEPWKTAQLVMLYEKLRLAPDRERLSFGFDSNYEYKLSGFFSGRKVYEPKSDGIYPEFVLKRIDLLSTTPRPIFRSQHDSRAAAAVTGVTIETPE